MKKWIVWIVILLMALGIAAGALRAFGPADTSQPQEGTAYTEQKEKKPVYNTRQQVYANSHPDLSSKEILRDVKLGLDREPYQDPDTVADPAAVTVFVNKHWRLPEGWAPEDLTDVGSLRLRQEAAAAWQTLQETLAQQGIPVSLTGGYLSPEETEALYAQAATDYGQDQAETVFSKGNFSDFNTGLTLMFAFDGVQDSASDPRYETVIEEAGRQGFIVRYPDGQQDLTQMGFQPLTLRYVGPELAQSLKDRAISFDEYFGTE